MKIDIERIAPPPNTAMQTDKVKLSRLLLAQKPRQLAFAADRERYAP